jgi:hypothetical protein
MLYKKVLFALMAVALVTGLALQDASAQFLAPRSSPKATVTQTIGLTDISITYSRPAVKGRAIWGGLVPYNQVWRLGANEATLINLGDDVSIEGLKLAKGSYSLHAIPTADNWTIIFNKVAEQWGSYNYKPEEDALRVTVSPRKGAFVERMRFTVEDMSDSTANVVLAWENLEVPFSVHVNTVAKVLNSGKATFSPRALAFAAQFASQNRDMEQAVKYLNASLALEENYQNTSMKANWLAAAGNFKEALLWGNKAVTLGKAMSRVPPDLATLEQSLLDWKKKK